MWEGCCKSGGIWLILHFDILASALRYDGDAGMRPQQRFNLSHNCMEPQDWKDKLGAAFGIDAEAQAREPETEEPQATAAEQQGTDVVNVMLDKRNRKGKKVTLVTDLHCDDDNLKELATELKRLCGVGGSARGGEILIQGDFREKVLAHLKSKGFKARII